ncbi:MAG: hypothetical protein ACRDSP_10930 [Pseudonocardiaceae bacterium]
MLEQLLGRAGWTPENLGDHLNRLAAALGVKVHVNRRYPRRWVYAEKDRATPRIPRDPVPSLVCLLLHQRLGEAVTPQVLGWPVARGMLHVPADDGLRQSWDAVGAIAALGEVVDADSMERRHFMAMTGLTLTAVAHQWLFDPARVAASVLGKRTDHVVVDDLERVVDARRRLDDALGGGSLLPSTREDLRLVVALLRNSSYTEEVGQRLYAVAAEFGRLAGWLAYDRSDRPGPALFHGRDAVVLAESALAAEQSLTPVVAASLYGRLALGAAHAGDVAACQRAQNRSFDLLATSVTDQEPSWIYWFTEADAYGLAGWSLLALGRPAEAEPHLRHAVAVLDPGFTRDRAGMLCDLATARIGTGAVERACATASEAATIIRRLDSPRQSRLLADFRHAAEPYASATAVREFDTKHRDLIRNTSA